MMKTKYLTAPLKTGKMPLTANGRFLAEYPGERGMVKVVVNGKFEIVSLKIEKDVVNPEDVEMLQDLIAAAVNEGIRKAQEMASEEMAKITGGLNIPGMGM